MLHVPEVVANTLRHVTDFPRFAAQAIDLRPPGHPRLGVVTVHVTRHLLGIILVVGHGMRPGADERHVAQEHI